LLQRALAAAVAAELVVAVALVLAVAVAFREAQDPELAAWAVRLAAAVD
jgi:hypothetical protein